MVPTNINPRAVTVFKSRCPVAVPRLLTLTTAYFFRETLRKFSPYRVPAAFKLYTD